MALIGIVLPPLVALETLRAGEPYSIETGYDDWFLIANGWSSTTATGVITTRGHWAQTRGFDFCFRVLATTR